MVTVQALLEESVAHFKHTAEAHADSLYADQHLQVPLHAEIGWIQV